MLFNVNYFVLIRNVDLQRALETRMLNLKE